MTTQKLDDWLKRAELLIGEFGKASEARDLTRKVVAGGLIHAHLRAHPSEITEAEPIAGPSPKATSK